VRDLFSIFTLLEEEKAWNVVRVDADDGADIGIL